MTGSVAVVWFGLLSIRAHLRARLGRQRAQEPRLGRVRLAIGRHQASAVVVCNTHWAGMAQDRHPRRLGPAISRAVPAGRRANRPPSLQPERRVRQLGYPSSNGAATPVRSGVALGRDPIPAQLRFSVLLRDGFRCRYCGRTAREPGVVLHLDHVVPVAAGGATDEDNLVTACSECNLGKSTRLVVSAGS
jgi:5-methylcytosine-specific restriction endonuclease McrA